MSERKEVFTCRRCGWCCEGQGGIVLSQKDLERLARHLGQSEEWVKSNYAEVSNGKLKIRSGADGRCVFYRDGQSCVIHEGRPDICRAWPYFRGNLEDPVSLEMAREYCPGIARGVAFEEFVASGLEYLRENDLLASDGGTEANALIISGPLVEKIHDQ